MRMNWKNGKNGKQEERRAVKVAKVVKVVNRVNLANLANPANPAKAVRVVNPAKVVKAVNLGAKAAKEARVAEEERENSSASSARRPRNAGSPNPTARMASVNGAVTSPCVTVDHGPQHPQRKVPVTASPASTVEPAKRKANPTPANVRLDSREYIVKKRRDGLIPAPPIHVKMEEPASASMATGPVTVPVAGLVTDARILRILAETNLA